MIKLLALVVALFALPALAKPKTIVLKSENTVVLRGAVSVDSVSTTIAAILKKDRELPEGKPIYLVIDSPGGDIVAGLDLIQAVKAMDREVKTVSIFAASMGFMIVQNLGERIVTPNTLMMSHRARGGVSGNIPGEIDVSYKFWSKYVLEALDGTAKRLNMTKDELTRKHYDEWWIHGKTAPEEGVADTVVLVQCGDDMSGVQNSVVNTFFGPIKVTWSKCPLVRTPLKTDFSETEDMDDFEQKMFNKAVHMNLYDRERYLQEFIISGKSDGVFK